MAKSEDSAVTPNLATQLLLVVLALAYVCALLGTVASALWYAPPPAALRLCVAALGIIATEAVLFGALRLFNWLNWLEHEIEHTVAAHARAWAAVLVILGVGAVTAFLLPRETPRQGAPEAPKAAVSTGPLPTHPLTVPAALAPAYARPAWLRTLDSARARNAARQLARRKRRKARH